MQNDLIYDIGAHRGEDTAYYLKKGFRVVAIEADPDLCAVIAARFRSEIAGGRLVIVDKAIAETERTVTLFRNLKTSVWNTLHPDWVERNRERGAESIAVSVEATTMACVISEHGVPHYAKIDIEGYDLIALQGFASASERPAYISIESELYSFPALKREFRLFASLGYTRFKLSPQHRVSRMPATVSTDGGEPVPFIFDGTSSGPFAEDLPGPWLTRDQAVDAYRKVFLRYALIGDDPYLRGRFLRRLLTKWWGRPGWYDTHSRHGSLDVR